MNPAGHADVRGMDASLQSWAELQQEFHGGVLLLGNGSSRAGKLGRRRRPGSTRSRRTRSVPGLGHGHDHLDDRVARAGAAKRQTVRTTGMKRGRRHLQRP